MPVKAVQFSPKYCREAVGSPMRDWDSSHDLSILTEDGTRHRVGTFKHAGWAEAVGKLIEEHWPNFPEGQTE